MHRSGLRAVPGERGHVRLLSGTIPVAEILFIESKQVFMWRIFGARLSWIGSEFRDMGLTDKVATAYREVDENWCAWLAATGLQPKEN